MSGRSPLIPVERHHTARWWRATVAVPVWWLLLVLAAGTAYWLEALFR